MIRVGEDYNYYIMFMHTHCADIDECAAGLDDCGENSVCIDTIGDFTCQCKPTFFESADGKRCIGVSIHLVVQPN